MSAHDDYGASIREGFDLLIHAYSSTIREALDVLEEIVRSQWVHTGDGRYRQPDESLAAIIADLLATRRSSRWERIPIGLQWRPETDSRGSFVPYEHRGPGGADII